MRTLIVGNDRAFESRVVACLERDSDMDIVGIATDGREGVRLSKQFLPELVIMQFDMGDMTGPALTRTLKSDGIPPPAVIIISRTDTHYCGQLAYRSGADGYLTQSTWGLLAPLIEKLKREHGYGARSGTPGHTDTPVTAR